MKKYPFFLIFLCGLLCTSFLEIHSQQPVTVETNVGDFYTQKALLSDLGLAVPPGFNTFEKGQSLETKVNNAKWLNANGWKKVKKGDKMQISCKEKGTWILESKDPGKPFSVHVNVGDFMYSRAILTKMGLQIPSGFRSFQAVENLPPGEQVINSEVQSPDWLVSYGCERPMTGDKVSLSYQEKNIWLMRCEKAQKPCSVQVDVGEFYN